MQNKNYIVSTVCAICGKQFNSVRSLCKHLKTHNIILDSLYSVYCRIKFRKLNFIGVSSAVCQELNRKYGKHNVFLVKNAIDTSRFNKENKISNKNSILIFGTLYETKGVDIAIKALENSKIKNV